MSSPGILRSFLRTSSIASPRADQTDSQSSPFSLKSSPSFNDFSLGVGGEGMVHIVLPLLLLLVAVLVVYGERDCSPRKAHVLCDADADSNSAVAKSAPDTPCSASLSRHSMDSTGSPRAFASLLSRRSLDSSGLRHLFGTKAGAGAAPLDCLPSSMRAMGFIVIIFDKFDGQSMVLAAFPGHLHESCTVSLHAWRLRSFAPIAECWGCALAIYTLRTS